MTAEDFGSRLAMAYHRVSFPEAQFLEGYVGQFRRDDSGAFHKQACALAAVVYERAGKGDLPGKFIFQKLATYEGPWLPALERLGSIAIRGLSALPEATKQANVNPRDWFSNITHLAGLYPKLLTASAALGTVGGGLAWAARNDPRKELEQEDEKTRLQIELLNSMTNDMEIELRRKGYTDRDANVDQ